jgi:hypothetical protein
VNVEEQAEAYRQEMGDVAMRRQQNWMALGYYPHCWAAPSAPHTTLCPNAIAEEEAAWIEQEEALF